jgi:hypothetical protein
LATSATPSMREPTPTWPVKVRALMPGSFAL